MTKDFIFSFVREKRHQLISAYNFNCKESAANCAFELTNNAITHQYVNARDAVPGATLRGWAKKGNPPLWACRSAADILLKNRIEVRDTNITFLLVYFYFYENKYSDVNEAIKALPEHIDSDYSRELVRKFIAANIYSKIVS